MSLPTLRETLASMATASPEPSIIRAVNDEPNDLAREWPPVPPDTTPATTMTAIICSNKSRHIMNTRFALPATLKSST